MIKPEELARFRERLTAKRNEVFAAHKSAEEDRVTLMEPDSEFEEKAQNESMADIAAQLDVMEAKEILQIDRALLRIELGEYGSCEICGKPIEPKRLESIPWTSLCSTHAKIKEKG